MCIIPPDFVFRIRQVVAAVSAVLLATTPEWQRILTTRHVLHVTLPRRMGYHQAQRSVLVQLVMRWLKQIQSETSYQRRLASNVRQEQPSYLLIQLLRESKLHARIHSLFDSFGVSLSSNALFPPLPLPPLLIRLLLLPPPTPSCYENDCPGHTPEVYTSANPALTL